MAHLATFAKYSQPFEEVKSLKELAALKGEEVALKTRQLNVPLSPQKGEEHLRNDGFHGFSMIFMAFHGFSLAKLAPEPLSHFK